MPHLVSVVLPIALIIAIGCFAGRFLRLESQTLSQLTLYILSPALIIDSLYRTTLSLKSTLALIFAYFIASFLLYVVVWSIGKIGNLSLNFQKSLMATTLFSNNGNLGLPFVAFSLGSAGLERAIIYMIASSILMFGFGPALLRGGGFDYGLRLTLKLPLLWSIAAGLALRTLPFEIPFQLDLSIQQLGQAAIPLALIMLGIELADTRFRLGKKEALAAFIRLAIAPLIAYLVGQSVNLSTLDLQVLVIQSAMPTAVSTLVLVTEFGGDAAWVARTIVVSTIISFMTLP
ncbi:MAG: AEC family transporter, partial [Xenococcaceae cyanobacterium]